MLMELQHNKSLAQNKMENLLLQSNYADAKAKLKAAMANIEPLKKELNDAKTEVHKYHKLYMEGTKLLNAARRQCEVIKAFMAKQTATGQTGNGLEGTGRLVVAKTAAGRQQDETTNNDTKQQVAKKQNTEQKGTQQQDTKQQATRQQATPQKGTKQQDTHQQGTQQQDTNHQATPQHDTRQQSTPSSQMTVKRPEKVGSR